jgi:hypothetical protein
MTLTMTRRAFAVLALLCGCHQDIDIGDTRMNGLATEPSAPAGPQTSAPPGCAFDDPAQLVAPAACPEQTAIPGFDTFATVCLVTADGPVRSDKDLPTLPACPTGAYFTMNGTLPPVENIEHALLVLAGKEYDKRAFAADTGTPLPRTVEVFPDRGSFFVRLDPRPSAGLRVNVLVRCQQLVEGTFTNPCGYNYGYTVGFLVGAPPID